MEEGPGLAVAHVFPLPRVSPSRSSRQSGMHLSRELGELEASEACPLTGHMAMSLEEKLEKVGIYQDPVNLLLRVRGNLFSHC